MWIQSTIEPVVPQDLTTCSNIVDNKRGDCVMVVQWYLQQIFELYRWGPLYWLRKYLLLLGENLPKVTDNLHQIMLYKVHLPPCVGIKLTTYSYSYDILSLSSKICSHHDIAEIPLWLTLNTNQSIYRYYYYIFLWYSSKSVCC